MEDISVNSKPLENITLKNYLKEIRCPIKIPNNIP